MSRPPSYKPLLFTTTMRNPERLRRFLAELLPYDGKILDDNLAKKVAESLIVKGLYRPTLVLFKTKRKIEQGRGLTEAEIKRIFADNPQNHKEAGFSKGWPSRFDTWFKFAKELGFVFYRSGEKIKFSEAGKRLAKEGEDFQQSAFLNAFVKYQSDNPFRRVLNSNAPLILLLQTIKLLKSKKEEAGISKLELPLLLYWKNADAKALAQRIKTLRRERGFNPSGEMIVEICRNEIMQGKDIVRNAKSILADYPDDFIRKMRLTGLVSLRGGGRFIDINKNEQAKADYALKKYAQTRAHANELAYFNYMAQLDKRLILATRQKISASAKERFLTKWAKSFSWPVIKSESLALAAGRLGKNDILKYLSAPIRLEFLSALAIKSQFPKIRVVPNYPVDDEGLPTSTAGGAGDAGDIECFEGKNGVLIEVTMSQGRAQTVMEIWPIARHLEKFQKKKAKNAVCYFVAPSIFSDSADQIGYVWDRKKLFIVAKTISEFLRHIEKEKRLYFAP